MAVIWSPSLKRKSSSSDDGPLILSLNVSVPSTISSSITGTVITVLVAPAEKVAVIGVEV